MPGCGAARLVVIALSLKRPWPFSQEGLVAEWLRRGLQILAPRFDSGRGLQNLIALISQRFLQNPALLRPPACRPDRMLLRARGTNRPARCSPCGFSSGARRRPAGRGLKAQTSPIGAAGGALSFERACFDRFSYRCPSMGRGAGLERIRRDPLRKCQGRHGDDDRQADDGEPKPEVQRRLFRICHHERDARAVARFPIVSDKARHCRYS
jgi:hypothetical protein